MIFQHVTTYTAYLRRPESKRAVGTTNITLRYMFLQNTDVYLSYTRTNKNPSA